MQLVEQGKLDLDSPATRWVPDLADTQVLEGWDADGQPRLRAPKRPITLRHLLTHTAGFAYDLWSADLVALPEAQGHSRDRQLQEHRADDAAAVRSGRALGVWHQHRLGRQDGRSGQRQARSATTCRRTSSLRSA